MLATIIKHTDGSRELQYWQQILAKNHCIDSYTYVDLSESKVKEIRDAKTEDVQEILSNIY